MTATGSRSGGVAPATGFHRRGDLHFNDGTANGTNHTIFYYCAASGTPGTWLRFAQLVAEPSLAIGYQAGAGGAITQATSKSTAVTLHKPCGQVTMHNASLAAGAMVSFTLTSNNIAATDTVAVSIASGASADSYDVSVTAVGNTTCRIQLRNLSAAPWPRRWCSTSRSSRPWRREHRAIRACRAQSRRNAGQAAIGKDAAQAAGDRAGRRATTPEAR